MTAKQEEATTPPKNFVRRWVSKLFGRGGTTIPVVRLQGAISPEQRPGRLNVAAVAPLLERAFKIKQAPAIAIIVNSPGGSPVQSRLISKMIRDLAEEHDKQVLVFIEDVAASGGYFIAVAGDEIIADPSSIVGSIGVIYAGFGFEEAIKKIGVKRRIHTAGRNKSTLDPFVPEKKEDVERLKAFELDIHQVFIDHVKSRRADKFTASDDDLFTGEWWTAGRGLDLGLVDSLGDMHSELKARFGKDVKLKPIAAKRGLLQLPSFRMGTQLDAESLTNGAIAAIEDRAIWSRFGL